MRVDLDIRFSTKRYACLCFTHAVQEAMKGIEVETEIDEFGADGNDARQAYCQICYDNVYKEECEGEG